MSQFNPITGSIAQAPTVQRQQAAQRADQLRHLRELRKNSAANSEDEVEQSVASSDELQAVGDENQKQGQRKYTPVKHTPTGGENEDDKHVDLTA
jgi:hypothetical protein